MFEVFANWKKGGIASITGILMFALVLPILAQDKEQEKDSLLTGVDEENFLTSGLYGGGISFIDGDAYVRLQLQPDIPLGKIGVGLDLVLLYNPYATEDELQFLAEDGEEWDSPSTYLRLIRYIRYGRPYDPFYTRFGELEYLTIGHGSIMSGYSNYDRRGLRLNLRQADNRYGLETMVNNLGAPTIFGGRMFYRPFQRPENNNLLTRFEVGATYLTDIDPNLLEDGEEPFHAVGVDVGFPILERSAFRLDLYNDFVLQNPFSDESESQTETEQATAEEDADTTTDLTWGNAVGVGFAFTTAIFKVEYRIFADGYIPSVFDYMYEATKSQSSTPGTPDFLGMETNAESRRGFFSQFIWHPVPQIHFLGTLEDYTNTYPKLYLGVTESGLVPRLAFRAFYTKRDIGEAGETNFFGDLFDLDEKSAFTMEIRYELYPPLETVVLREYRFRRVQTETGDSRFEPIHKTSLTFGIKTNF